MKSLYQINVRPNAVDSNIIQHENLRLTVLTHSLVRLEWSNQKSFVDLPTQKVWYRDFDKVPFIRQNTKDGFYIETDELIIEFNKEKDNLRDAVKINLKNPCAPWNVITGRVESWRYGDKIETLPGTSRTLDNTCGEIPLEDGIISKNGFTVLDDSKSSLIMPDGTVKARENEDSIDIYFFAYGHRYKECLADFFALTGKPPLLPRWALGNWWSRYHKYTDKEYLELMDSFKREEIPLSVAMIDMDWHITEIDGSIGSGWTGYSWNKKYFPKPKEFLSKLHSRNLKVSLNVHPAEGVGRHEDEYKAFAKAMGLEADGKTIPFDFTDDKFIQTYFEKLHHPLEKQGVDFWWIDWQQGTKTAKKNLDPLWLLNHYHYLDNSKNANSPLILSRYAGPGSHRYPIGFSGDTVISWQSLKFQPYFTSSASNIGYGWWSHDIGGHMLGSYDEELQVRWVQFGVFSPIMRLHSSQSRFNHKEPWLYDATYSQAVKKYMRLRHKMIPYLYTMNERFAKKGEPLMQPMYYSWPEENDAYNAPDQYMFGSELVCAPVINPVIKMLHAAPVKVWLPKDTAYTDIFTGVTYCGGKTRTLYRTIDDIPVLLKEGGILVLADDSQIELAENLPSEFEVYVARKTSRDVKNIFTLFEDGALGEQKSNGVKTDFTFESSKTATFTVGAAKGDTSIIAEKRKYTVHFLNCNRPKSVTLSDAKKTEDLAFTYDELKRQVTVEFLASVKKEVKVQLKCEDSYSLSVRSERCAQFLDKANIDFVLKEQLYGIIKSNEKNPLAICQEFIRRKENPELCEALIEFLESN